MPDAVSFLSRLGSKILGISTADYVLAKASTDSTPAAKGHPTTDAFARVTEPADPLDRIALNASRGRVTSSDDAVARVVAIIQDQPQRLSWVAQYVGRYNPAEVQKHGFVYSCYELDGDYHVTMNTYGIVMPYTEFVLDAATGRLIGLYEQDLYHRRCGYNMA